MRTMTVSEFRKLWPGGHLRIVDMYDLLPLTIIPDPPPPPDFQSMTTDQREVWLNRNAFAWEPIRLSGWCGWIEPMKGKPMFLGQEDRFDSLSSFLLAACEAVHAATRPSEEEG